MYIPAHFKWEDREAVMSFLQAYPFALLITAGDDGAPVATHLPFVVENGIDGTLLLTAHMARANPQWQSFGEKEVLVVFSGPHAYISPAHYSHAQNVPTWNYAAVHAYGKASLLTDPGDDHSALQKLMAQTEPGFLPQYESLDPRYTAGLFNGIVAFEISVTRIDAKEKLSQNKTPEERQRIITALKESPLSSDAAMGDFMEKRYGRIG
jgi:transcriptional regulator